MRFLVEVRIAEPLYATVEAGSRKEAESLARWEAGTRDGIARLVSSAVEVMDTVAVEIASVEVAEV